MAIDSPKVDPSVNPFKNILQGSSKYPTYYTKKPDDDEKFKSKPYDVPEHERERFKS